MINPDIIHSDGTMEWHKDGLQHRENAPAVMYTNNASEWWWHGKLHRDNGPAVIYSDGSKEWWLHGVIQRTENAVGQISLFTKGLLLTVTNADNTQEWYKEGQLHRDGGEPAVIANDGRKEWYKEGQLHREFSKGAAVIRADGSEEYWADGYFYGMITKDNDWSDELLSEEEGQILSDFGN